MQVVKSYKDYNEIRFIQKLRLYHMSRPQLKKWRKTRHNKQFKIDAVDQWILNNINSNHVTMVDCAGWYLEEFGVSTTCLESDSIAQHYWPSCYVEPDIFTHRPTYISEQHPVIFKNSWFLKYATVSQFVNFLSIWVKGCTVVCFNPIYVQHNHLKYKLIDIVRPMIPYNIQTINHQTWVISP